MRNIFARLLMGSLLLLTGCAAPQGGLRHGDAGALPAFPATPVALDTRCRGALAEATDRYGKIASGEGAEPLLAYEEATALLGEATDPLTPLTKLHPDPAMRRAAADCKERVAATATATLGRDDLFRRLAAAQAVGADQQRLQALLLAEFRDQGLGVPEQERASFQKRAARLADLESEFTAALVDDPAAVTIAQAELAGVPADLTASLNRDAAGHLTVADSGAAATILRTATMEATRQKAKQYLDNRGPGNLERLAEIARLRNEQAWAMGKESWLAVRTASQMAGSPERVNGFLDDLHHRLTPRVAAGLAEFARLKGAGSPVQSWDLSWLRSRLITLEAGVDEEELRPRFPLATVRQGLFDLAERLFGLRFRQFYDPGVWSPDVALYQVAEADGTPVGWLYLDLFARPGKADSSYEVCLRPGRMTPDGLLLPVALLVTSLHPAASGEPHLLPRQVKTLLHEFGHVLHDLLGRASYASLGTALIPWDAIETPSTLFELLAFDSEVLALLSGNRLPAAQAAQLQKSQWVAAGSRFGAMLLTAQFDADLHGPYPPAAPLLLWQELHQKILQLPAQPESRAPGAISHMVTGYDGRYYGYLWSAVIAADLQQRLVSDGLLSRAAGDRLRRELLAPGNSRPPDELIRGYLGRDFSADAFRRGLYR